MTKEDLEHLLQWEGGASSLQARVSQMQMIFSPIVRLGSRLVLNIDLAPFSSPGCLLIQDWRLLGWGWEEEFMGSELK